ncbi:MAG: RES family NAD+ phosphorylase [Pseudomonadota bacterium]|nr:hypothetical protein [Pseudomonadales bacterium]MDY6919834.1 RES family NAD+ phosphorylase [Pseudomonadota bacterium]
MTSSPHRHTWVEGPQYRIIPTRHPPINFFERFTPPELMADAFELESLTNERLLEEVGNLQRVAPEDRISGPGATVVMAAFTHTGYPSRFTDGRYGIYYAARDLETAIRETVFHRERFLGYTREPACEVDMRVYKGTVEKPLIELDREQHGHLLHPDPGQYGPAQTYGAQVRAQGHYGILYPSVRRAGGYCIAALRPTAVSRPVQSRWLVYHWDGQRIAGVYEKRELLVDPGTA